MALLPEGKKKERKLLSTFFEHRIPSLDFESWLDKEIYDVNSWEKLFPQARRGHIIMEKKHHGGGEQKKGENMNPKDRKSFNSVLPRGSLGQTRTHNL